MSGRWKRIGLLTALTAALAAAVAVSLASAMTDRSASPATAAATNLTIMGFGTNGDDVAKTRYAIAEKAVGGGVSAPNGAFDDQQFLAALAAGDVPDLVYFGRDKVGTYAAKGALVPLTSCIKSHKINMKQYRSAAVHEVSYKGKVYAIPEFYDVRTVIVNLDVLNKAGVKLSQLNTANWPALKKAAKKLYATSGGKVSRIGFDPKLPEFFPLWAKANGVDILSKDGLHPHLNDPRAIAALQYSFNIPASPASAEFFDAWTNAVNSVLTGQASPRSALNKAQKVAVAAIKNAQK